MNHMWFIKNEDGATVLRSPGFIMKKLQVPVSVTVIPLDWPMYNEGPNGESLEGCTIVATPADSPHTHAFAAVRAHFDQTMVTPFDDRFGFGAWVWDRATELADFFGSGTRACDWTDSREAFFSRWGKDE
jgi:hypothetical protein